PYALRRGIFSPDAAVLALSGQWKGIVLFDTATGKELRRVQASVWPGSAFAPDGKTLASGSRGGSIDLWDVDSGMPRPASSEPSGYWRLRFKNDGKALFFFGDEVSSWDITTGKPLRRMTPKQDFWTPALSSDGKLLATWIFNPSKSDLAIIDAATGAVVHTLTGHDSIGSD